MRYMHRKKTVKYSFNYSDKKQHSNYFCYFAQVKIIANYTIITYYYFLEKLKVQFCLMKSKFLLPS